MPSRYNFAVPVPGAFLLYNAASGAILALQGGDATQLVAYLVDRRNSLPLDSVDERLAAEFVAGGFLVDSGADELALIRDSYWQARHETPMVVTVTTTMDCNLACYYCYEERSEHRLELADMAALVKLVEERLTRRRRGSLHVDWYGGEPLLNQPFIEAASPALQRICERLDIRYSASVISNGTCWPEDVGTFIDRHSIRQVQISFDGMRRHHNRRRRYRRTGKAPEIGSSFDRAVRLVDSLLDHTRVDLRFNLDRRNQQDVYDFIAFARDRGWFRRRCPAVLQPARLAAYSERSEFMRKSELSLEEFDVIRARIRAELAGEALVEESEAPDGLPIPRSSVCAALANDSVVVGAEGSLYRCGLQVGELHRTVGRLHQADSRRLPILGSDELWWDRFDPTTLPTCSRCSFLPICWAGCPKKHLEADSHAIAEQGAYWRTNLPRLIAEGVGYRAPVDFALSEMDQFR